jgi:hypothetical protein
LQDNLRSSIHLEIRYLEGAGDDEHLWRTNPVVAQEGDVVEKLSWFAKIEQDPGSVEGMRVGEDEK